MSSDGLHAIISRLRANAEEHERRLREDPEYRAAAERKAAALAAEEEAERRYQADEKRRERRFDSDIPPRVARRIDAGLERTPATQAVEEFLRSPLTMLFLGGGEGCGKTVAACAPLDRRDGLFVKAAALLRARFDDDKSKWQRILRVPYLVVDDIETGALDDKGWMLSAVHELLDARYDGLLKVVVTTNLTAERFLKSYATSDGGRLRGRIREAGRFVELDGGSMRVTPESQP